MVIKNQKSILSGEDTHAAVLSGSVTVQVDQNVNTGINGNSSGSNVNRIFSASSTNQVLLTLPNIITPSNSIMIINTMMANILDSGAGGSFKSLTIKRDGVDIHGPFTLASSIVGSQAITLNTIALTPVSGTHTYTLVSNDGNSYGAVRMQIIFVNANDTHAATLTGANTQDTRDQGIIQG